MTGKQIGTLFGYPIVECDCAPKITSIHWDGGCLVVTSASCSPNRTVEAFCTSPSIDELGSKLAARLLLAGCARQIIVPSSDEMRGVYLLELDDELPGMRRG